MRHSPDDRHHEALHPKPLTRLALDPEILHGGIAGVVLPPPPAGCSWRVEWRVIGQRDWHVADCGLDGGAHAGPDTGTREPAHRIEWRAVAELGEPTPRSTICGARPATPKGYTHPDYGPLALCPSIETVNWTGPERARRENLIIAAAHDGAKNVEHASTMSRHSLVPGFARGVRDPIPLTRVADRPQRNTPERCPMARRSRSSSRRTHPHSHTHPSNTARLRPGARDATVLPLQPLLHASLLDRRTALCDALTTLADTWRRMDLRDEPGWSAFVADAGLSLARYLVQHAADVRSVMVGRDIGRGVACRATALRVDEAHDASDEAPQSGREHHPPADDQRDMRMDAGAERAADAAVLAFLGVADALSPAAAMSDIIEAATALGLLDSDAGMDVECYSRDGAAAHAPVERQAS